MPFSSNSGKASIKWVMSKLPAPLTALDIGCGEGTYAKMFPKLKWTGVEIWEPYVEKYNLRSLYPTLILEDARKFNTDEPFDVCFLGDVLEHMALDESKSLVEKAKKWADTVVISIPIGHYPQDEYEGNPHERHVTDNWTDAAVKKEFGEPTWSRIDKEIGVYVYSKHKISLTYCVYAISKNEEKFVERFCKSAQDADLILIADTGSTDKTALVAKDFGAIVHEICISPWRFDLARNAVLALIPRSIDICISLDLDELLEPGWKEEIERVWSPGETTRLRYMFDWGCGIKFLYEKIHARHGYRWHHPCHEYPVPDGRVQEVWAHTNTLLVSHHPDPTKSRGQYLDLLELSVKEDPHCPRNAFYYARELTFHQKWLEASMALDRYLNLPRATWQNERCYAYRLLGQSAEALGSSEAESYYLKAAQEAPNTREPWVALSNLAYRQRRWRDCYDWAMKSLEIKDKALVYTCDPAVWGAQPHDLAAIAAWNLGMKEEAIKQGSIAAELAPEDKRIADNLVWFNT